MHKRLAVVMMTVVASPVLADSVVANQNQVIAPDEAGLLQQVIPPTAQDADAVQNGKISLCKLFGGKTCPVDEASASASLSGEESVTVSYQLDGYQVSETWIRKVDPETGTVYWRKQSASQTLIEQAQ